RACPPVAKSPTIYFPNRVTIAGKGQTHERRHSPPIRGSDRHLRLRQQVHHAQHQEEHHRRNLLGVPPVLHRQDEVRGHHRPRREVPEEVQLGQPQEGRRRTRQDVALSFSPLPPCGERGRG